MDLPYLPFRQIVDELIDSLGMRKSLTLRWINGRPRKLGEDTMMLT